MLKRLFDVLIAGLLLVVLMPIVFLISLLILVKLGSPILFIQRRPGYLGIPFDIYKFRTMNNVIDQNGNPLPDSDRLTRFGSFIRSTSLDELPCLLNVLKGEMSLVGPRPLLMEYLPLYNDYQKRRHQVRPGVTGWAQVNGRNTISWNEKFEFDIWYVENQSFLLDIKILSLTFKKVILRDGITKEGEATTSKFTGNSN
jgi:lipopolysaccharide/colanic/teichoic acid biosynthesis glycosyltransferase